mmetsp:Transcript_31415/g.86488  ORF Transcript_31415/g.86488 Transcript_31415/m.86488 type:complete len:209 (-) Transcript_31415:175-801(-)
MQLQQQQMQLQQQQMQLQQQQQMQLQQQQQQQVQQVPPSGAWPSFSSTPTMPGMHQQGQMVHMQQQQQPVSQQWACTPGQQHMFPTQGQMVMQQPGPWAMQAMAPAEPQMSPWARVLAHLESKGIAFADIKACHIDTRRDILKEVFLKEPLARAQAEMEWMKAKSNAIGTGASRPVRARSRSRDRMSQATPGMRPCAPGSGLSYIMPH